jgi:hypothetical protein
MPEICVRCQEVIYFSKANYWLSEWLQSRGNDSVMLPMTRLWHCVSYRSLVINNSSESIF